MEISLREARRLADRISAKLNTFELNERVNLFNNQDLDAWLQTAQESTQQRVLQQLDLINIRTKIRRQVQAANEESGINELIANRKDTIECAALWKQVKRISDENSNTSSEYLAAEKQRSANSDSMYGRLDKVLNVPVINEYLESTAVETTRDLQRLLDKTEDEIARLNSVTKITVDSLVVDALTAAEII